MINVETFNHAGDVIASETFINESGARRVARIAFNKDCGCAINGVDCFTFAEVDRAINRAVAMEVAA